MLYVCRIHKFKCEQPSDVSKVREAHDKVYPHCRGTARNQIIKAPRKTA